MTLAYKSTTTLNRIRKALETSANTVSDGWETRIKTMMKAKGDDEPINLLTVLDCNGLDDALWVLSYAMPDDILARNFQSWCKEHLRHLLEAERPKDPRIRDQIAMMRNDNARFAATAASTAAAWDAAIDSSSASTAASTTRNEAWDKAWYEAWTRQEKNQERQLRRMIGDTQ